MNIEYFELLFLIDIFLIEILSNRRVVSGINYDVISLKTF